MAHSPSPQPPKRELSRPVTVAIASVGSVVAAIVVSKIWGPGTLIGAAATPVIITLVVEGLRKPVETVVVRTPTGTAVHEVGTPRPRTPVASEEPTMVLGPEVPAASGSRRGLKFALVTGLIAFVIGAFVLTSTELLVGDSAGSGGGTTLFDRSDSGGSSTREKTKTVTTTKTETTPPTVTETTTEPAPETTPTDEEETTPVVPEGTTGATGATGATGTTP